MKIKNMKQLHAFVRKREDNTCQICSIQFPDEECCAHHCRSKKAFPHLKLDPDICICVDAFCHHLIHSGQISKKEVEEILTK